MAAPQQMSGGAPTNELGSIRTLWIGDLAYYIDEAFLTNLFASTNTLLSVKVIRNRTTQVSEGYGFLEFSSHEAAQEVLSTLNGKLIPGTDQTFRLNWAAFGVGKLNEGDTPDYSVFVGDLAADVSDYTLLEHFKRYFASVRSAKVITDPMTGRSKGYGFVRFGNEQERDRALGEMMGHFISNRPIRVSIATAKKNPPGISAGVISQGISHPSDFDPTNTTLFIGGLTGGISEEDLKAIFAVYGDIIYTKIPPGKGCGFVQFVQRAAAEAALLHLQGQVIGATPVRLSWGRSSSSSRTVAANPGPGYTYSGAYPAAPIPGYSMDYGTAGYMGLPLTPAVNPYAAYAYSSGHHPENSNVLSHQVSIKPSSEKHTTGRHTLLAHLFAAHDRKPDQVDPMAALDVEKANAALVHRNQTNLFGPLSYFSQTAEARSSLF